MKTEMYSTPTAVVWLLFGPLLLSTACTKRNPSAVPGAPAVGTFVVTGDLGHRSRVAIRSGSFAVIQLQDVSLADASAVVLAEQRIDLNGAQAPIPFQLTVDRGKLAERRRYAVRGAIRGPDDRLLWTTTDAYPVDPAAGRAEMGLLMMSRVPEQGRQPETAATTYDCGDVQVAARLSDRRARISIDGEQILMAITPAASGAKYAAPDDPATFFWTHGNEAMLEIRGKRYPECQVARPSSDPAARLQGPEWTVEDVNGGGIIDRSRGTLQFTDNGSVAGRSFCNTYRGSYTVSGTELAIGQLVSTKRACVPALANLERLFADILSGVERFEFTGNGALILRTGDGRTVTSRR